MKTSMTFQHFNLFIITSLSILLFTCNVLAQENIYFEKTTKTNTSGIVVEKFEKTYLSGENEVSYITEKRNMSLMGNNQTDESKSVVIKNKEWIITYDPDTKTGTKIKNTFSDKFTGMSESDMKKFAEKMGSATNTKITDEGTRVVAGKTCKISKAVSNMMGMTTTTLTWIYNNIVMKMESKATGTSIDALVTLLKEGGKFNPEEHKVPSDVEITEVNYNFNAK
jgi:hypothetical protein